MLNGGRSSCCLSFGFCLSQSPNFFFNSPTSWGVENFQLRPNHLQGAVDGPELRFKIALPLFFCGVLLGVDCIPPSYPAADDSSKQRNNGGQPNLHRPFIHNPSIL